MRSEQTRARRVLQNAMDVLIEERGQEAAKIARTKVDGQEKLLKDLAERASELEGVLKVASLPSDFAERIQQVTQRLVGLNGLAPAFWPFAAKRALLAMFFGGPKSTRFDRAVKGQRSKERGIFIVQHRTDGGERYWTYEARGGIADLSGALTRIVSLYDDHIGEQAKSSLSQDEILELARMADKLEGFLKFPSAPTRVYTRVEHSEITRAAPGHILPIAFSGEVKVQGRIRLSCQVHLRVGEQLTDS